MKKNKLLVAFLATLILAILLRLLVIDVISVSNDLLQPQFFPGDFLLVSKVSDPLEGDWALLKDYPKKNIFAIRKLLKKENNQGWEVLEPPNEATSDANVSVTHHQILGKAVMILWSLPCKPAATNGQCSEKKSRYFKLIH